jgi:hypothetical protein
VVLPASRIKGLRRRDSNIRALKAHFTDTVIAEVYIANSAYVRRLLKVSSSVDHILGRMGSAC